MRETACLVEEGVAGQAGCPNERERSSLPGFPCGAEALRFGEIDTGDRLTGEREVQFAVGRGEEDPVEVTPERGELVVARQLGEQVAAAAASVEQVDDGEVEAAHEPATDRLGDELEEEGATAQAAGGPCSGERVEEALGTGDVGWEQRQPRGVPVRRSVLEQCRERFVVETGAVERSGDRCGGAEVVVERDISDVLPVVRRGDAPGVALEEMEHGGEARVEVERRWDGLEIFDETLPEWRVTLLLASSTGDAVGKSTSGASASGASGQ